MDNYEEELKKNEKRNEKFLKEFDEWLDSKNLSPKTKKKHLGNVEFYLNYYLNYYEVTKMEEGIFEVRGYLNGWFIEKCAFASRTSIKENAASIKKFYQCMSEKEYVKVQDYKKLCVILRESMDEFFDNLDAFDNGTYWDQFL